MPDTEVAAVTDDQKAAIIAAAVQPFSSRFASFDKVPTEGPIAMVWFAGYYAAMDAVAGELGVDSKEIVKQGNESLADDFALTMAHIRKSPNIVATPAVSAEAAPEAVVVEPAPAPATAPGAAAAETTVSPEIAAPDLSHTVETPSPAPSA